MKRDEHIRMQLAGTVTFPGTFPHLGQFAVVNSEAHDCVETYLVVSENSSTRVKITRRVSLAAVRAVFLPNDLHHVNYSDGQWLLNQELTEQTSLVCGRCGIAFIAENAPCLMDVSVGLTAAEASQYYPPLPSDQSRNHYDPTPTQHLGLELCEKLMECDG